MTDERTLDIHFPLAGMDTSQPFGKQPARPIDAQNTYARTSRRAVNVRAYDADDRRRGGTRPGLLRKFPAPVTDWIVQNLTTVTTMEDTVQFSSSGRLVTLVAVAKGNVYSCFAGDSEWTAAINGSTGTPPLRADGLVFSTAAQQKLWFADGTNFRYYDPHINQVLDWVASAGSLPRDASGNAPRLIGTWRGRIILAGLFDDPQLVVASAVDSPRNFDFSPLSQTATQAFSLQTAPQGLIGDVITSIMPMTDDVICFGGDSSLVVLKGDPMAGGEKHIISTSIGMCWGRPWCIDPRGTAFFVSNKLGVYAWAPDSPLTRISMAIEQELGEIDTGLYTINCLWNDRAQGMHVFVTLTEQPEETTHFFFDQRTGGWFMDKFENKKQNPLTCTTYDGNEAGDRVILIGGWDGFVRSLDPTADDDDGYPIESEVVIGPLVSKTIDDLYLRSMQAVLGTASGDVKYEVFAGRTAEEALSNPPVTRGTFKAGRNHSVGVFRGGYAIYIRLSSSKRWAMEVVKAQLEKRGKAISRQRG